MELRDYQSKSIENIRKAFAEGHRKICFQLPTGGGKTILAAFMMKNAVERGLKVLFLVHLKELVDQTREKLDMVGVEYGLITSNADTNYGQPVQLAMVQTLNRRLDSLPIGFDLILTDEAHHCTSATYKKIYDHFPDAYQIGLTATPQRLDGKGLKLIYDKIVRGPKVEDLIERGHLSPYRLFSVPSDLDLSKVHTMAGDYNLKELAEQVEKSCILGDAVKHYKRFLSGEKALVFCTKISHSIEVARKFNEAGIAAAHVDGKMSKRERNQVIEDFRVGKCKVLCNCSLISEGFDVPDCSGVILLRPTQSLSLYLQMVGRGLRPVEGKTAIILDHVGNCVRHGLPDDDRQWTLEGKKKGQRKTAPVAVTVCEGCFNVYSSKQKMCPYCYKVPKRKPKAELEEVDGDLVEVTKQTLKKPELNMKAADCRTLEELQALGRSLGYKPGWAIYRWNARRKRY